MRRLLATVVALSGLVGMMPVQAGSLVVNTASGTIGGITMLNEGINATGTATILITELSPAQSFLNNVNGVTVLPDPVAVESPVTLLVTPTATLGTYTLALSPPTYNATIGPAPGAQAVLVFNQTEGVAPLALPDFVNLSGSILSVSANNDPTYDFSRMAGGDINLSITGTTFTGTDSFIGLFSRPGASVTASGSFSLSAAVPEPASMTLMGSGAVFVVLAALARRRK